MNYNFNNPYYPTYIPSYQTIPQPKSNTNKIVVNSIDDVKNMNLPANSDYIFVDNNSPILYQTITDNLGKCTIKAFSLTELELGSQATSFVNKEDFNKLLEQISNMSNDIKKLAGDKKNESSK